MSDAVQVGLAATLPALLTLVTVPLAIRIAERTGFLDAPRGYKAHLRPTPYLGGAAVLVAALPCAALIDPDMLSRYWPLFAGAVFLAIVGAIDDRVNLSPWLRLAVEAATGWLLWVEGLGWSLPGPGVLELAVTAVWVMALVNAFNLMDNLDGAAASVAAISATAIAVLAAIGDNVAVAMIAAALAGSLVGFLRFNLAEPARIFLGDGGSMPVGFLVAGGLIVSPMGDLSGWGALVAAGLIAGLPIFDTALVTISRRRRGVPVLTGGTDHTSHRLLSVLKTPRRVALALATGQAFLCGLAIEATALDETALTAIAALALLLAAATIVIAETPRWVPVSDDS